MLALTSLGAELGRELLRRDLDVLRLLMLATVAVVAVVDHLV